jgi:hypothetical protein
VAHWQSFINAARRKIRIAQHHLGMLKACYPLAADQSDPRSPDIRAQAYFEGVLYSYIAASDQLKRALETGYSLTFTKEEKRARQIYLEHTIAKIPNHRIRETLDDWQANPIRRDAKDVRNSATHSYYGKRRGAGEWEVDNARRDRSGREYPGDRGLAPYCHQVVEHALALAPLLDQLGADLDRFNKRAATLGA